jgi:hypothetical protein
MNFTVFRSAHSHLFVSLDRVLRKKGVKQKTRKNHKGYLIQEHSTLSLFLSTFIVVVVVVSLSMKGVTQKYTRKQTKHTPCKATHHTFKTPTFKTRSEVSIMCE